MVDHPIGGTDYPRTFQEFRDWFPDDDACLDYLEHLRWPDGFVCPECGCGEGWRISQRRMWMCAACQRKTSVTAGTIFHRSHTAIDLVRRGMVRHVDQERGLGAGAAEPARVRLV